MDGDCASATYLICILARTWRPRSLLTASMSERVGGGRYCRMRSSWLMVLEPGKSGFPRSISARIQPSDQRSTPFVYLRAKQRRVEARNANE